MCAFPVPSGVSNLAEVDPIALDCAHLAQVTRRPWSDVSGQVADIGAAAMNDESSARRRVCHSGYASEQRLRERLLVCRFADPLCVLRFCQVADFDQ